MNFGTISTEAVNNAIFSKNDFSINLMKLFPKIRKYQVFPGNIFYLYAYLCSWDDVDNLVQDCSNSIANALELLQSCTKPSMQFHLHLTGFST